MLSVSIHQDHEPSCLSCLQDQRAYDALPAPCEDPGTPAIDAMVLDASMVRGKAILAEHRIASGIAFNDKTSGRKVVSGGKNSKASQDPVVDVVVICSLSLLKTIQDKRINRAMFINHSIKYKREKQRHKP